MFYFSRLQFGQYLAFLADIDIEYYHPNIKLDTEKYNSVCEDFWKKINSAFKSKGPFDSKKLGRLIKKFDDLLTRKKFHNMKVYELFFKHYAFFRNCPYGFMHIEHDNKDYQNKEGNYYFLLDFSTIEGRQRVITKRRAAKIGAFPTIGESLAQGMRWYPVITNEGEFR